MRAAQRLERANGRIDRKALPFANALKKWLDRFARYELRTRGLVVKRAEELQQLSDDLRRLVLQFGLVHASDAGAEIAGQPIVPGALVDEAIAGYPSGVRWFWDLQHGATRQADAFFADTRAKAQQAVADVYQQARGEWPTPSAAEVARRVRGVFTTGDDRSTAFSQESAMTFARSSLVQAENTGIVAGYHATGVQEIEWLAYKDGRSEKRHHERMNGVIITLGEKFVLPSGAHLRYPGDPDGPISETINCRCTTAPVRR